MIERKIDSAGNVVGFFNTDTNKWEEPTDSFERTSFVESNEVVDADAAQSLVDRREDEKRQALDAAEPATQEAKQADHERTVAQEEEQEEGEAADSDDDGEPQETQDYNSWTKDQLRKSLDVAGVPYQRNASKDELVALMQAEAE